MRYYWCVNCGNHGDFKFYRARNVKCEECAYDPLTELDEEEYNEWKNSFGSLEEGEDKDGKNEGNSKVTGGGG